MSVFDPPKKNKPKFLCYEMPEGIGEFGLELTNPIPLKNIQSSTLYLEGLRASDGTKVDYERLGSFIAANIQKPIDNYLITHNNGTKIANIYISHYQEKNSKKAPNGLEQVSLDL